MLERVLSNQDVIETLNRSDCEDLEERIFQAIDRVQALCTINSQIETGEEGTITPQTRANFAFVLEDQVRELRRFLEQRFE